MATFSQISLVKIKWKLYIDVYEVCSSKDIDSILFLESIGKIAPFSHRKFLMKKQSFSQLQKCAIESWESSGCKYIDEIVRGSTTPKR
jgi:hypothetical protein